MSTTIIYTNLDNAQISVRQLEDLGDYKKIYLADNIEKKVEIYENHILNEIQYIKAEDENINDIFSELGTNSVTIKSIEAFNDYSIKTIHYYIDGMERSMQKQLLMDNKIICNHEFGSSGNIDVTFSAKYMYDPNGFEISEEIFSFYYYTDGTLNYISGKGYPFSDHNQFLEASEIQNYFPNLFIDNPYYLNSVFLP